MREFWRGVLFGLVGVVGLSGCAPLLTAIGAASAIEGIAKDVFEVDTTLRGMSNHVAPSSP